MKTILLLFLFPVLLFSQEIDNSNFEEQYQEYREKMQNSEPIQMLDGPNIEEKKENSQKINKKLFLEDVLDLINEEEINQNQNFDNIKKTTEEKIKNTKEEDKMDIEEAFRIRLLIELYFECKCIKVYA
jgi:hypothetical protein